MQSFTNLDVRIGSVPFDIVRTLRAIDTGLGAEALYRDKLPALLTELAHRARVASITASSALEGYVVPNAARAADIIEGRATTLRTRSEEALAGYRLALDYLYQEPWRPLNVGLILHLHRLLFSQTDVRGGSLKREDNVVVDRNPDGTTVERFRPVPAEQTEFFIEELVARYLAAIDDDRHHPVLVIGLFVLDLLTIHPFDDGNGRVTRVLTNALLEDAGYGVTRYVSLELTIAQSADDYYAALLASTRGWMQAQHDPWPWLRYFVGVLERTYRSFEARASSDRSTGTKQERVRDYVLNHASPVFRIADIRTALPGVSDQTIRLALDGLRRDGLAAAEGTGRGAVWRRSSRQA